MSWQSVPGFCEFGRTAAGIGPRSTRTALSPTAEDWEEIQIGSANDVVLGAPSCITHVASTSPKEMVPRRSRQNEVQQDGESISDEWPEAAADWMDPSKPAAAMRAHPTDLHGGRSAQASEAIPIGTCSDAAKARFVGAAGGVKERQVQLEERSRAN